MAFKETNGFIFIWKIENFSFSPQKQGEMIKSPVFKVAMMKWCLAICPRGAGDFIGFHLFRCIDNAAETVELSCDLSFLDVNGRQEIQVIKKCSILKNCEKGFSNFMSQEKFFGKTGPGFLKNNTLTACCRIWEIFGKPQTPTQCFACTRISINNIFFVWRITNFIEGQKRRTTEMRQLSEKDLFLTFNVIIKEVGNFSKKVNTEIITNSQTHHFSTCKISILDSNGKEAISVEEAHWFSDSNTWQFPTLIEFDKLVERKNKLLPQGTLSLRFDITTSDGIEYNRVERIKYETSPFKSLQDVLKDMDSCYGLVPAEYNAYSESSLKEHLLQLYNNQKFSDSALQTESRKFPVHKAILCSRSQVFDAMFTRNMAESQTGIVKISDLDEDVVQQMLLFIYTGIVEDLQWGSAFKLYFAADKYDLRSMKQKCSSFIKNNLDPSNVCQALVLADLHQDTDMFSFVQDYIIDHADKIIITGEWKKFMQSNAVLAAETLHLFSMRKLNL